MTNDGVLMAGNKVKTLTIFPRAISGSPITYDDVLWWKVTYSKVLVIRGKGWTKILKGVEWGSMRVEEAKSDDG
jgi:hypothetical protein